jgi:hypothetical protein
MPKGAGANSISTSLSWFKQSGKPWQIAPHRAFPAGPGCVVKPASGQAFDRNEEGKSNG